MELMASEYRVTDISLSKETDVARYATTTLAKGVWDERDKGIYLDMTRGRGEMKSYELGSTTFN